MIENLIFPKFMTENFVVRLLMASLLGGIIGLERDIHGRSAGLRTNMLISLGAAVFMVVSEAIAISFSNMVGDSVLRADPSRIAAQIITGIGFLGAGAIIKHGFSVRGLTTAACIWISSGIGMSAGAGFFELAIVTTIISLFSLIVLNKVEKMYVKDSYRVLEIETANDINLDYLLKIIKQKDIKIVYFDNKVDYLNKKMLIKLTLKIHYRNVAEELYNVVIKDLENNSIPIYTINWAHL